MQLDQVSGLIELYTYFALFPLVVVEGPIVSIIAGVFVHARLLNPFITYLVIVIGDVVGDIIWYGIGRSSRGIIARVGHLVGFRKTRFDGIDKHFEVHSKKTIFFGKFAIGAEVPILVAAGVAKLPFGEFFVATLVPTMIKTVVFLAIGYYFGGAFEVIDKLLNNKFLSGIIVAVLAIVFYFFIYKRVTSQMSKVIKAE